ncbi:hypothetical protein TTHERM_00390190 (macronuclear) [Tetrahymena thermophila SB210]|uniref:Uncharacterized protein n=1 Tax=Tetrahymena thermophila (strain SB210) TaxID=312017 RepID=Q23R69_TETTS|nr:hypothetical protein TTHERM_00390190 [Tetrahymena thermophila SB210]EAR99179.4 hypothetical protein TTHERM_00390190 [Tetrahymena thermophila SB210]|eukprot:XP_001019424.4 hypothetical protein TTHERM_00390190 [Tetrahymena thermophila SB210]
MSQQNFANMESPLDQSNFYNQQADNNDRQIHLKDKIFSIVDEQIGSKLKLITDRYENQQQSIDQQQDMLKSLLNTAEKILSNLEKQNEQKQAAAAPKNNQNAAPTNSTLGKKIGSNLLQSSLMGISSGLPVINEAVPLSQRLSASVNQLPAQANLSKIAKGAATLDVKSKGLKTQTKENHEEESQKVKPATDKKETHKEQLKPIEEGVSNNTPSHKSTASTHIVDNSKIPKIQDLKTLRNLNKNKSMVQLKQEENNTKQEKSKFSDNKDLPNKTGPTTSDNSRKSLQGKKDEKPKQNEDEEKPKTERKPAIPKVGASHEKAGSDSKNKDKSLKNSASVSQFNSVDPKSLKSDKAIPQTKTKQNANKKNESQSLPQDSNQPKIIPKKIVKENNEVKVEQIEEKQPELKQEIEKIQTAAQQNDNEIKVNSQNMNQNANQEKQVIISEKDISKHEEDENLLDDIANHHVQTDTDNQKNIQVQGEVEQRPSKQEIQQEFDQNAFKTMINQFFEGKITADQIKKFCKDNQQFNEEIDETLIFTQIDLQKIVDEFNEKYPDSGNFSDKFKISQNTKEGLQLIDVNFIGEMVEKECLDQLVLQQYELFFFMLDGPEIQEYRKTESKENYVREYMNTNYEKFVEILLSLEDKVQQLNQSYEKKLFIKEFIEKNQDITNQDQFYNIEPLCALISPLIEEIIVFMGLSEQDENTSKKNIQYFKYQDNQMKIKRIADLNQIIVDNTYNSNTE